MSKPFKMNYREYDTSEGYGNAREWNKAFHKAMTGEEADFILSHTEETKEEILGIILPASLAEIKRAFRKKLMEWHPDLNPHRIEEAEAMTKKIIAAYTKLS
jgi:DnaJ-class molecular chaperone